MFDKNQKIKIKDKLKDIKYKCLHQQIFNILQNDENFNYSHNSNGLYFDINKLNCDTLNKINELLNTIKQDNNNNNKLEYKPYFIEEFNNIKLNTVIKKLNL